jgi:hypothetical protein
MNYPLHILSLCIASILLPACGGDGGSSEGVNNSGSSTDTTIPSQPQYPEPTKDVVDANALGFYDAMSSTRAIRSALTGSICASTSG